MKPDSSRTKGCLTVIILKYEFNIRMISDLLNSCNVPRIRLILGQLWIFMLRYWPALDDSVFRSVLFNKIRIQDELPVFGMILNVALCLLSTIPLYPHRLSSHSGMFSISEPRFNSLHLSFSLFSRICWHCNKSENKHN